MKIWGQNLKPVKRENEQVECWSSGQPAGMSRWPACLRVVVLSFISALGITNVAPRLNFLLPFLQVGPRFYLLLFFPPSHWYIVHLCFGSSRHYPGCEEGNMFDVENTPSLSINLGDPVPPSLSSVQSGLESRVRKKANGREQAKVPDWDALEILKSDSFLPGQTDVILVGVQHISNLQNF